MTAPAFDIPGYQLVRELGAGGMATVFLAVQTSLERRVAIKVMRRGMTDDNVEKRFLLEGRTMARLPHPNIVGVFDIVQNESINYIAMECLDGGMLSDRMRDGLSLAEAISIVVQIAGALQFAHDNGIVHRDLKPANIMFRDAQTPVLTDFGIARQQDPTAARLTQTGMMIGTPTYMSPEQATGGDIDGRSDQYALGVLFYEMLTGHPPFDGDTPIQVVLAHLNTPPPTLPPQFAVFQPIMDRLLAKSPDARFADLRLFSRDLKTLLASNDSLLHRLRIDPNQSASEQLRGLGFSESQIHTGSARISGNSPRTTGGQPRPRTGSGPGVQMDVQSAGRKRPVWLLPALGGGGVLGLVLAGWLLFSGGDELDPVVRKLVDDNLSVVSALIEQNKLVSPEGNNAFERLQNVLQAAPDYPPAKEQLQRIADLLREQAEKALQSKSFDVAETRIGEALAVNPQDPAVQALHKRIQTAKLAAERELRIGGLLQRAESARLAGKVFGDDADNALALLRQARDIEPDHAATKAAQDQLSLQILQPATAALRAGKLDDSERLLQQSQAFLAGEPAWQALQSELQQARQTLAQAKRIDELLGEAQRRLSAGRVAEPAGDNALESLARINELDPSNTAAATLAAKAGATLYAQAQKAEQDGNAMLALTRYDQALRAIPGRAEWAAAKSALEQRLGDQQKQLSRALADANAAITARRYYSPAGSNARDALDAALQVNPNDATAKRLNAELPGLALDAAQALADEGRLDDALALIGEVVRRDPGNRAAAALNGTLSGERDRLLSAERREKMLTELRGLLARRQLNVEIAASIGTAIAGLQKLDINDTEALGIRQTFLQGVGLAMSSAQRAEQLQAIEPVLAEIEKQLGARSPDVAALRRDFVSQSAAMAAKEQERLAALAGLLLLNAQPWANVESVVEQSSGRSIALGSDRSTPLRLSIPEGTYRITFRHPDVAQPVVRLVTLKAKASESANASFPTLDSREYLKRAGYAP